MAENSPLIISPMNHLSVGANWKGGSQIWDWFWGFKSI